MQDEEITYSGVVTRGEGSGAKLGFPTANIPLTDITLSGIYAGFVTVDGSIFKSAIYANKRRGILEAHILGFSGNVYGKVIAVTLQQKIREDKEFGSFPTEQALSKAIANDITAVRSYFEKHKT